ncbi:hypothetical protein FA362_29185, partial [Pseudomonas aeruginosa]|nr:hypothetical protein [Pseudomonas aeruginosa]
RADAKSKKLCKLLRTSPENRGAPDPRQYVTKYFRKNPTSEGPPPVPGRPLRNQPCRRCAKRS